MTKIEIPSDLIMLKNKNSVQKERTNTGLKNMHFSRLKLAFPVFKCFSTTIFLLALFGGIEKLSGVRASIASVDSNGVYNKLTVKISEQVPRQLCQQTLDTLEVSEKASKKLLHQRIKKSSKFKMPCQAIINNTFCCHKNVFANA